MSRVLSVLRGGLLSCVVSLGGIGVSGEASVFSTVVPASEGLRSRPALGFGAADGVCPLGVSRGSSVAGGVVSGV